MTYKRLILGLLVTSFVLSSGAFAIPPAYHGPKGNPEEPATRPYKAFWRGVRAIPYQMGVAMRHGRDTRPILGNLEVFRGFRRGGVEFLTSAYTGMAGSFQPPHTELTLVNIWIDNDRRAMFFADYFATVGAFSLLGCNSVINVFGAGAVTLTMQQIDYEGMSDEERAAVRAIAWYNRERLGLYNPWRNYPPAPDVLTIYSEPEWQSRYHNLGVNQSPNAMDEAYSGNLIKKKRRGRI